VENVPTPFVAGRHLVLSALPTARIVAPTAGLQVHPRGGTIQLAVASGLIVTIPAKKAPDLPQSSRAGESSPAGKRSSSRCCWFRFSATLLPSFDKGKSGCEVETRNPPPSTKDPAPPVRMGISPGGGGLRQIGGHDGTRATTPKESGMGVAGPSYLSRGNTPPQNLPNPPAGPATRSGRITRIPANSLVPTPSQRAGQRRKARPGCAEGTEHGSTAEMGRRLSRKG